jgi:polysaccharide export outer membrane protein
MKTPVSVLILPVLALLLSSCRSTQHSTREDSPDLPPRNESRFVLGPSDQISISVWRNSDMDKTVLVSPSGYISLALIGNIKASGLTIPELTAQISTSLEKYIVNPQVDVNVVSIRSRKAYVFGEVQTPGSLVLDHATTPVEAIAMSGGFLKSADQNKVMLIRAGTDDVTVETLNLNLRSNDGRETLASNFRLQPNDMLYVVPSTISNVESFMVRFKNILNPFVTAEQAVVLWPQAIDAIKGKETLEKTPITVSP